MLLNDDASSKNNLEKNKKIKTRQYYEQIIYRAKEYRDEEFKKEVEEEIEELRVDNSILDNNIINNKINNNKILIKLLNEKIKLLDPIQHQTTSLLFNNKQKIRKDVLIKLANIARCFEEYPEYPMMNPVTVRSAINGTMGTVDHRTEAKYYLCVRNWVKKLNQIEPELGLKWNMSSFSKAIQAKWVESEFVE